MADSTRIWFMVYLTKKKKSANTENLGWSRPKKQKFFFFLFFVAFLEYLHNFGTKMYFYNTWSYNNYVFHKIYKSQFLIINDHVFHKYIQNNFYNTFSKDMMEIMCYSLYSNKFVLHHHLASKNGAL